MKSTFLFAMLVVFFYLPGAVSQAQAQWWRTPAQQANDALQAGDTEQLQQVAPDADWQAIAAHKNGDYGASSDAFADLARQYQVEGDITAATRALYNQGVSDVLAGEYEKAMASFDQVLQSAPEFEDAAHNREITRQLIEQQQQQQQQQSGDQSGDEGGDESSDNSSESGEQPPEGEQGNESGDESGSESNEGQQAGEQDEEAGQSSEEQQQRDAQAARDALEAQAQEDAQNESLEASSNENDNPGNNTEEVAVESMTESDQATEQWLRRIPDDPAGLLRRKLEQSHRTEFPEVNNALQPW